MNKDLEGQVAVITGSTGGLGAGIAQALADHGAAVVISGRRVAEGEQVALQIIETGGQAFFVKADVASESDCVELIRQTVTRFGRIDILINNAAITPNEPALQQSAELWDAVFEVNLRGAFICCREVIPIMRQQQSGRIINIGSTVPFAVHRSVAERMAYACSKGALLTMTKLLARELLSDRILVNWITVGWLATPGEIALRNEIHGDGKNYLDQASQRTPLGRLETVEEIAAGVIYLVSNAASHVTGCELNISGGLHI